MVLAAAVAVYCISAADTFNPARLILPAYALHALCHTSLALFLAWWYVCACGLIVSHCPSVSICQGVDFAIEKLNAGGWVNVFPEGRVNQQGMGLPFKWGAYWTCQWKEGKHDMPIRLFLHTTFV